MWIKEDRSIKMDFEVTNFVRNKIKFKTMMTTGVFEQANTEDDR